MRAVVFSVDDAFVMPFKVLFHSLFSTGSVNPATVFFVLHEASLSQASLDGLAEFFTRYQANVSFVNLTNKLPNDLPLQDGAHVSRAAYYRLFVGSVLPDSVDSILYLDSDAVVIRSIAPLLETPLTAPIAAVDHCTPCNQLRLWGAGGGAYFQSGVVLIDVAYWRKHNLEDKFKTVMWEDQDRIRWWDQDVLNIVFKDRWQRLPWVYNVALNAMKYVDSGSVKSEGCFIHYDGSSKPWLTDVYRPLREHWFDAYQAMSGDVFKQSSVARPAWRRFASKVKLVLNAVKDGFFPSY